MSEDQQPPNIVEFGKWLGYHLSKDWRMLMKAPIAFLAVLLIAIGIAWIFIWQVVVPMKNEQLTTKQGQVEYLTKKLEESEKDGERLKNDLAASRTAPHDEKTFPLKKRALILSAQIKEYQSRLVAARGSNDQTKIIPVETEWRNRFENRVPFVLSQLDEYGQHSEKLESANNALFNVYGPDFANGLNLYAEEIGRMANNLPDTP
jgi:hypothetical protein